MSGKNTLMNGRFAARCTLDDCPAGLFVHDGVLGFKTEYTGPAGPDAYVVLSGEFFWGGVDDVARRRNLIVTPVMLSAPPTEQQP